MTQQKARRPVRLSLDTREFAAAQAAPAWSLRLYKRGLSQYLWLTDHQVERHDRLIADVADIEDAMTPEQRYKLQYEPKRMPRLVITLD